MDFLAKSGYHSSDLDVQPRSQTFNLEMYAGNGPWNISNTSIFIHTININNKSVKILQLQIKVERLSGRHLWDLVPISILSTLQVLVFVLPYESGERIGFSVTIFLAEVLFLTVIQEKIPEASNSDISYLVYKQLVDLITSFVTISAVVLTNAHHNRVKKELEKTETPGKRNSVCIRKEADKANIEEPEETKEIPSEMNSVGIRQQKRDPKFWRNAERRINLCLIFPCIVVVLLNNVIFMWLISGF